MRRFRERVLRLPVNDAPLWACPHTTPPVNDDCPLLPRRPPPRPFPEFQNVVCGAKKPGCLRKKVGLADLKRRCGRVPCARGPTTRAGFIVGYIVVSSDQAIPIPVNARHFFSQIWIMTVGTPAPRRLLSKFLGNSRPHVLTNGNQIHYPSGEGCVD